MRKISHGKFDVLKDRKGNYYFVIKAENGRTLCHSESYASLQACMKGVKSVVRQFFQSIDVFVNGKLKCRL